MTLSHDVSVSEMLHMRNAERMSNREIAEKLDCSTSWVFRMIGKQPEGIRAPRCKADKPITETPVKFTDRLREMRPLEEQSFLPPAQPKCDVLGLLKLVFGQDAVRQYIAMRLYELKVAPGFAMSEEDCIRELREMQ